ncbi:MAG: hypothetical protein V1816_09275 [Pseudomonadota bacterium]
MSPWPDKSCRLLGVIFMFAAVLVAVAPSPARAHKVYLFAWVEGNNVQTESYFSKSRKVQGGVIKVFDSKGALVLRGTTDDQGNFSFPVPGKDDLRIEVEAGMGHKGDFTLTAGELPSSADNAPPAASSPVPVPAPAPAPTASPEKVQAAAAMDPDQLKKILEQSLDEKLKPLIRQLAELQEDQGPGATEIIGGLGWVFGLMGLAIFFRSKKRRSDPR